MNYFRGKRKPMRTDMTDRLSTQVGHLDLGKLDGFR